MKKLLLIPALAFFVTACRDNSRTESAWTDAVMNSALVQTAADKEKATKATTVNKERVVYTNSSNHAAQVEQKKGMSRSAKYAIIGGAGGAVIGGVATKSVKGAVIGGVVGAGGGYIIGRKKDKKTGRIQ